MARSARTNQQVGHQVNVNLAGLLAVAMLSLAGCSAGPIAGGYVRHGTATRPAWELVMDACETQPDGSARCQIDALKRAMLQQTDERAALETCAVDLVACERVAGIDCALNASMLSECNAKLDDAWRSPWIWGAVGLLVGGALGVGIAR